MTFSFKSTFPSLLYALTFVCHISPALSTCYNFDGSTTVGDIACQDSPNVESTCCPPGYICLSNRVCQRTQLVVGSDYSSLFIRGSCTDINWKSPFCPNFCVRGEAPYEEKTASYNQLGKCEIPAPNVFFCVNSINTDWKERNCSKIDSWFALPGSFDALTTVGLAPDIYRTSTSREFKTLTVSSSSSAAITPASATTSTSETTVSESPTTSSISTSVPTSISTSQPVVPSSNNSRTTGVAAGLGIPAGLAIIGVIGWLFIWRKRRGGRVELEAGDGGAGGDSGQGGGGGEREEETRERFSELPSEHAKSELTSERVTSELSAGSWKKASVLDGVVSVEAHRNVDNEIVRHELSSGEEGYII